MPRTATTFLQRQFFPQLSEINYFGLPYTQINPAFQRLMYADESLYNPRDIQKELQQIAEEKVLFSNENFIGQSLFWHFGNRTRIAQRLQAAMPDATIILFLRNQPDLLRSAYEIALQESETKSLSEFVRGKLPRYDMQEYRQNPAVNLFDYAEFDTYHAVEHIACYDFLPLIKLYKGLFKQVEVFLFEDFKRKPAHTLKRLTDVLDISVSDDFLQQLAQEKPLNSGINARQAQRLRKLNRWREVLYTSRIGRAFFVRARRGILRRAGGQKLQWSTEEMKSFKDIFGKANVELHGQYPEIGINQYANAYLFGNMENDY